MIVRRHVEQKGFTLIEILTVIAIIGILSAVVAVNISGVKNNAVDGAIKQDLSRVLLEAELQHTLLGDTYGSTGVFGQACASLATAGTIFGDARIQGDLQDAKKQAGADGYCNLSPNGSGYAIVFPLKTPNHYWCIDATGASKGTVGVVTSEKHSNLADIIRALGIPVFASVTTGTCYHPDTSTAGCYYTGLSGSATAALTSSTDLTCN